MRIGRKAAFRSAVTVAALMLGSLVAPAIAKAPELAMLGGLTDGSWELNYHGAGKSDRICVRSGRELIQLKHRAAQCNRYVVDDNPNQVTVQYTCPGDGYGRTSIRRETGQLVQIDSQGIENGMPFHLTAEARRVGAC
jgi:hypothetical protein